MIGGCIITNAPIEQPKVLGLYVPLTVMYKAVKQISSLSYVKVNYYTILEQLCRFSLFHKLRSERPRFYSVGKKHLVNKDNFGSHL